MAIISALGFTLILCSALRLTEYIYLREWRKELSDVEIAELFARIERDGVYDKKAS